MNLGKYAKAIVAAAGVLTLVLSDSVIDLGDTENIVQGVVAILTALGVWAVKNVPQEARAPE